MVTSKISNLFLRFKNNFMTDKTINIFKFIKMKLTETIFCAFHRRLTIITCLSRKRLKFIRKGNKPDVTNSPVADTVEYKDNEHC